MIRCESEQEYGDLWKEYNYMIVHDKPLPDESDEEEEEDEEDEEEGYVERMKKMAMKMKMKMRRKGLDEFQ